MSIVFCDNCKHKYDTDFMSECPVCDVVFGFIGSQVWETLCHNCIHWCANDPPEEPCTGPMDNRGDCHSFERITAKEATP